MGETGKRPYDNPSDNRSNFKRTHTDTDTDTEGNQEASGSNGNKQVVFRVICPDAVIGSVIGKRGKVINRIQNEAHARVEVMKPFHGSDKRVIAISSPSPDKDLGAVDELSAGPEPLCPAQAALLKIHEAVVHALVTARKNKTKGGGPRLKEKWWLLVPASQAAGVIGKGGAMIKRVISSTGADVKINPKDPADATHSCALEFDNFLHIAGKRESVKRALFAISTIMCKFPAKEEIPLETFVPQDLSPSTIIPSYVPFCSGGFFQPTDPIRTGLASHVAELSHFTDTASRLYAPPVPVVTIPPARTEELLLRVLFPRNKIGRVIGKEGSTLKGIKNITGACIDIHHNFRDKGASLISIISTEGTNDLKSSGVEVVLLLQEKITDEARETAVIKLLVPKKNIGCLIGKGDSIINDMHKKTNADIHITKVDPKQANSPDEIVQASGEVANVRNALVYIVLRLREDALRVRDEAINSLRDGMSSKPVLPSVDMYPSSGLPLSWGLPTASHLSYDRTTALDVDRGLGVYPSTGLYEYSSLQVDDSRYGALPSYSSKSFVGALPYVEMVIPGNALPKVLGKACANLDNIRRISGAHIEIVDSKSSPFARIAHISGTPKQQQSAEDLINAFTLLTYRLWVKRFQFKCYLYVVLKGNKKGGEKRSNRR